MVATILDGSVAIMNDNVAPLKARIIGLETENARLRASLSEVRSKLNEIDFIVERLKVENRGPPGATGPRGRDGRDGVGLIGPRGEAGPRGKAAPRIASWIIHSGTFEVQPLRDNGTRGAVLPLRPLFEIFNEQILAMDEAAEIDAAAASREVT